MGAYREIITFSLLTIAPFSFLLFVFLVSLCLCVNLPFFVSLCAISRYKSGKTAGVFCFIKLDINGVDNVILQRNKTFQ